MAPQLPPMAPQLPPGPCSPSSLQGPAHPARSRALLTQLPTGPCSPQLTPGGRDHHQQTGADESVSGEPFILHYTTNYSLVYWNFRINWLRRLKKPWLKMGQVQDKDLEDWEYLEDKG